MGLLLLAFSPVSAQLYIGPAVQVGMTYSKNYVIKDTSRYYIGNSPSLFAAAGLDLGYQFDKNIRVQAGLQGQYRSFNLPAPDGVEGLTFTNIKQNTMVVAIPISVNYRIPIGSGGNKFFNVMAGHSLDFVIKKEDSIVLNSTSALIDSGGSFARHEYQFTKTGSPISSVLLGVGADMVSAKGNILNISLVWGISTRQMFRGSIREWNVLHQSYNPTTETKDPEEFPDHYYEWALRGSNVSLKATYLFQISSKDKEGKKDKDKSDDSGKVEKTPKAEKPAKEKSEKAPKEEKEPKPEKAPKEKKEK